MTQLIMSVTLALLLAAALALVNPEWAIRWVIGIVALAAMLIIVRFVRR